MKAAYRPLLIAVFMSLFMSITISIAFTLIMTGYDDGFFGRLLFSIAVSFVIALPTSLVFGPISAKIVSRLVK